MDVNNILIIFYLPVRHKECILVFVSPHPIPPTQSTAQCIEHSRHTGMLKNHNTYMAEEMCIYLG